MRLTDSQKAKYMDRLWEITELSYTGASLPTREFFERCVNSGHVYIVDSLLLGFPIKGYALVNSYNEDLLLLRSIAVHPQWRNMRVGEKLLRELGVHAKESGYPRVLLHVKVDNVGAQRLYLKHGYKVKAYLKKYFAPEGDGLEMERIL